MLQEKKSIWDRIGAFRFAPGKGVTQPPPERGWKRFFFVLGTHFWKLISLNLLFLAFCIPIVTIPAAFCGMNRVIIKLYREGNCFVWTEFYKEFRSNLFKAMPFGVLGGMTLFASYYFLSLSISAAANRVEVFSAAIGILLLLFAVLFLNYAFIFLPTLDLKNSQIAKNAFIFLITEGGTNLIILASVATTALVSVVLFPFSLFPLMLLSFSWMQYVICAAVNDPLQKRIIDPFETPKKEEL
ncbi:MAG: DUF624 domain-containing protein [Eubacteriales bacterium]|jgi:hypothetical protein|nr:DUF624 domain-containing protein [Eubacteriales bacterium]